MSGDRQPTAERENREEAPASENVSGSRLDRRDFMKAGSAATVFGAFGSVSARPDMIRDDPDTGSDGDQERREAYLEKLLPLLHLDADDSVLSDPRISNDFKNWEGWLKETGELPPDFKNLPASASLPDPLVRYEDGERVRITNKNEWEQQRDRIGQQLQHWVYGSTPPAPGNVRAIELEINPMEDGEGTVRDIRLEFGPDHEATMTVRLLIPNSTGKRPVFMTQWNHRSWARRAVERGYIGVIYAGADSRDDTDAYQDIYPDYDFQVLARRAWGASRVVDYLHTLPIVNRDQIGITGFSRNGKQALLAGAFDDRISATVPAGSGTGGALPARFDRGNFFSGDMAYHTRVRRSWFHPRWRFFIGRENRLPVDANSLVSMVAPQACMIDVAVNDLNGNAWSEMRVYESALPVYELYDAEDALAVRYRQTGHEMPSEDVDGIIDFFDYTFGRENRTRGRGNGKRGRGNKKGDHEADETMPNPVEEYINPTRFYHGFSFEEWKETAAAQIDIEQFPKKGIDDLLIDDSGAEIASIKKWESKKPKLRETLQWSFGERPPRESDVFWRPDTSDSVGKTELPPSETYGTPFKSDLYYPRDEDEPSEDLPAIIWLHPYSYIGGWGTGGGFREPIEPATERGFAFLSFDQIGCGMRKIEGEDFYESYPDWSKMGKMVDDTRAAVDRLTELDTIDSDHIYVLGYSLGATIGLYAAALDERISGVASVCGFSSFRLSTSEKEQANAVIGRHSHIHGHHPCLGLFRDEPGRMPFDFHEVLGLVAPRPVLAWAPTLDWNNPQEDVVRVVEEARTVYDLYGAEDQLELRTPYDINSFDYHEARLRAAGHSDPPPRMRREAVFNWLEDTLE
jgi:cephalosporin-C deacetylase-like acetyl esterase